jgi:uncharacterized membrane protein
MPSTASYEVEIALPRATIWEGLRDLTRAPFYVPGLTGVEITTAAREGVGASRRVFQKKGAPLDETVVEWEDGYGFRIRLHNGDKPLAPFKGAWFDYRLADAPNGNTLFRPALIYTMPLGPLGAVLDRLLMRGFATGNVRKVADNFKRYYETGETTNPDYAGPDYAAPDDTGPAHA